MTCQSQKAERWYVLPAPHPIPCKPVLPSRQAGYVYQVSLCFRSPSIPTGSPQARICLHFEPVLACTEMLQLKLGPDCFRGDRDEIAWVPAMLQCLCLQFPPSIPAIQVLLQLIPTSRKESYRGSEQHMCSPYTHGQVQNSAMRLMWTELSFQPAETAKSFMHILMYTMNVSECKDG